MSNVVDLLTSLLEQVTPSKDHTSDQWSNLISELKANLKESKELITNARDPLTESLSTILSALQSSRSSGSSSSNISENKLESVQTREEYTKKSDETHKSEVELSESVAKENENLSDPELQTGKKRKYSFKTVFRSFFGKDKQGESKDGDNSNEVTSENEEVERKNKPVEKALKRLRTSSISNYAKELYHIGSSSLSKRGDKDVLWEYIDEDFREELSERVPPLDFELIMPHEHVTSPEPSATSPENVFKEEEMEEVPYEDIDFANVSSDMSSKEDSDVVEDYDEEVDEDDDMDEDEEESEDDDDDEEEEIVEMDDEEDNAVSIDRAKSVDDTIEVDYSVTDTGDNMVLYEGNCEVDDSRSVSPRVSPVTSVGEGTVITDGKVESKDDDSVTDNGKGDRSPMVMDGVKDNVKDNVIDDKSPLVMDEGNTNTTAIVESGTTNLPDADVKEDSKVEATTPAVSTVVTSGTSVDVEKEDEFKEGPREFINKMRESKEHVYTPLREIKSTTSKVNLYLVATEMIKSKLFIFKRKMYVFNYNAVDPSVYFNQSYVNPEVDYSIQILAPIDGTHHHINFGDILRLKRVDAYVKYEKGKKYVNIMIPDKCNPTVRAWRLSNLDDCIPSTDNTGINNVDSSVTSNSVDNSGKSSSANEVTLVDVRPVLELTDNAEASDGNESCSFGAGSCTTTSDDIVLVDERLVIDGAFMPNIRRKSITKSDFEPTVVSNISIGNSTSTSSNTNENDISNNTSSSTDNITSSTIIDDGGNNSSNDGSGGSNSARITKTNDCNVDTSDVNVDGNDNRKDNATEPINAKAFADTSNSSSATNTNSSNTAVNTSNTATVNTSNTSDVAAATNDVEADNFEKWKRNSITVIGSDNLTYTAKDYNILMYLKEYSKRLDPVKVFRRPDLLRTLSQANSENLDFIVKVHNVAKDYTFIVSDATAKALVVELDPMLIENVFRSYNPVKKGDWIKLRSFYKAEGCSSLTLRPSSFACITRLPPMSHKVVGDEQPKPSEKNINKANSSKVNGLSSTKKENGRNRTVNLEVWTRTSCLNNSFPKRIKKSPSFIEKLLSTHHTVTFQKASPEPVTVEKEEGEISQ